MHKRLIEYVRYEVENTDENIDTQFIRVSPYL